MRRWAIIFGLILVVFSGFDAFARGGGGVSGGHSNGSHSSGSHISGSRSSGGSVGVRSYYRKDGTYVTQHFRHEPGMAAHARSSVPLTHESRIYHAHYSSGFVGARDEHGRIVRSEAAKDEFMRMTGYSHGRPGFVVDHIIPLKRGGLDNPSNMQWQTIEEAKAKDRWE